MDPPRMMEMREGGKVVHPAGTSLGFLRMVSRRRANIGSADAKIGTRGFLLLDDENASERTEDSGLIALPLALAYS